MASFRKSDAGPTRKGRFGGGGPAAGSPFSQSQILHLMKTEFARARRYDFPVACMLVQVNRLGALVDMHGGALREMVRTELGKLVHEKTRGADHLGLASDDRYLVVMPHTNGSQGLHVAERLRVAFHAFEFRIGGNELALSLSIGVASCDDQSTLFFDTMMTQAEAALEYSFSTGGNPCSLFRKDQISGLADLTDEELYGEETASGSSGPSRTEADGPRAGAAPNDPGEHDA
jgi:diguanylate cyclase (GGDEF)-like protein